MVQKAFQHILVLSLLLLLGNTVLQAQSTSRSNLQLNSGSSNVSYDSQGRPIRKATGNDSLQHRDRYADSITIFYTYFDSTRTRTIDSSINDFRTRYPLPWYYHTLGNYGTAAQSFFFNPLMKAGFDAGFHQYDIYHFTLENTKLFQTTRPYTELAYLLGSKAEQLIDITHTQNKKSNFNFSFEYQFSNSPGNLKIQNASQSNFRFTTHYKSPGKKYEAILLYFSNKTSSSENGGLQDSRKLDSLALNDPYELDTRLGIPTTAGRNPFNTSVYTGNIYKDATLLFRHHYDLGTKDSLVTDSVTYKLFYPRFRIEHTLRFTSSSYNFIDYGIDSVHSARYINYFNFDNTIDTIRYKDAWSDLTNEFSLISFPEKTNLSQFVKVGVALQNLKGTFDTLRTASLYNLSVMGEYRNRTRNQVWDIEARAQLYVNGFNSGDYDAYIGMKRSLGKKLGYLNIGFQNVNRSPSYILNGNSTFPVNNRTNYGKENTIRLFGAYENPRNGVKLTAEYFAVSNYTYFDSFFSAKQDATLFNVLHVSAEKKIKLSRYWNWYPEVHVQQTTGEPPVHIPFLVTRHRIAFEGNFYTNLFLSTGIEVIYHSPYKADNYSPFVGRYFVQNSETISNLPDINAFLHFRIKSFKGFVRAEGLNTLNLKNGFAFNKLNFMASQYPGTGLWIHVGVWWNFVN